MTAIFEVDMDYCIKQSITAKEFSCIADKCPATCCSGWSVIWTAEEIKKLKMVCKGELYEICEKAFSVADKCSAVKMNEDDLCPFLSDGLCEIHRQLGQEYLSYTCRQYPVITRLTGNEFIKSCKTTCYAVAERLLRDENSMQLIKEKATENSISAIITSESSIRSRNITERLEMILWDDSITLEDAMLRFAEAAGIAQNGAVAELNDVFEDIFGWRLILSDATKEDADKFDDICPSSARNIVRSLFMEWRIIGWSEMISAAENILVFIFSAAVVIKAYMGAVAFVSSKEELICTVSDIAGVLYSDNSIAERIAGYLSDNKLMNLDFVSYILK